MAWPAPLLADLTALRERIHVGEMVVVVGDALDEGLPSTAGLLRSLLSRLPEKEALACTRRIESGELANAADVIHRHDASLLQRAAREAWGVDARKSPPLPVSAALASLPCRGFATTAFHPRLHDAVLARSLESLSLLPLHTATLGSLSTRRGWVLHLLGSATQDEPLPLTTAGLRTLGASAAVSAALQHIASGSLLFAGFGSKLGPLQGPLEELQAAHGEGRAPKHYWLGNCVDGEQRHELQDLGLQVLDLGDGSLLDALRFLAEAPAESRPAASAVEFTHLRSLVRERTERLPWLSVLLGNGISLAEVAVEVAVQQARVARPQTLNEQPGEGGSSRLSLPDVLSLPEHHHALIGEAGSGKSTLLRHLVRHLHEKGGGEPIYLHCRHLCSREGGGRLEQAVRAVYGDLAWPAVSDALSNGRLVLLLDGLDEAAAALGGEVVRMAICAFLADHRDCRVLVASRPEAKAEDLNAPIVRMLPVEERDAVALLSKLGVTTPDPNAVIAELRADPGRRSLAESPLLLTLLASVLKKSPTLPTSRAAVYDSAVEHLLHRRFAPDGVEDSKISHPDLVRELLEHLCGRLHASENDPWPKCDIKVAFDSNDPVSVELRGQLKSTWGDLSTFLSQQETQVGLLVSGDGQATWEAPHRTLREYLAARGMVAELRANGWPQTQPLGVARALKAAKVNPERYAELFALMVGEAARVEEARSAIPLRWVVETGQVEVAWRALRDAKAIEPDTARKLWALRRANAHERDVDVHTLTSRLAGLVERLSDAVALFEEWLKGETNSSERFWCLEALKDLSAGLGRTDMTLRDWCEGLICQVFKDIPAERREAALFELDRWGWGTVPAGLHWVGSPEGEGNSLEQPQHRVRVTEPFRLMTVPVTNRLYANFDPARAEGADDRPVVEVDWYDGALFAAWVATLRPDLASCRLPSETEWEIGARGGTATAYWSGNEEADLLRVGWVYKSLPQGESGPQRVGQKLANEYGLFDVHGNVREWCSDPWDADAWRRRAKDGIAAALPNSQATTAVSPAAGRVIRGGSWFDDAWDATSAHRSGRQPTYRHDNRGLRLALAPRPRS